MWIDYADEILDAKQKKISIPPSVYPVSFCLQLGCNYDARIYTLRERGNK